MKWLMRFSVVVLALALLPAAGGFERLSPLHVATAHAQQDRPQRKTLLELLFGGALQRQRATRPAATAPSTARRVRVQPVQPVGRSAAAAAPAAVATPEVTKNEDAAKILVIGDFMASQLSEGLAEMFAENPAVVMVDRAVSLSGLVRDDVHDWPKTAGGIIDEVEPIAVVVLVGMNDRQQIRASTGRFDKLEDGWKTEYRRRADELARAVREKGRPLIWMGLPPVSKGSMNNDYLVFNEMYRAIAATYGGTFVDVWDGFMSSDGQYSRSGPDINGQIVALRRSDGINMTLAGKVKLGFYAEKAIKRVTGFGKDALVSSLGPLIDSGFSDQPEYDPVTSGRTVVVALGSPAADGGNVLEGEAGFLTASDARQSNSFELVAEGLPAQPREGRIDSSWGKPAFDLGRTEIGEPVLASMRGASFQSVFDVPAVLAEDGAAAEGETGQGADPAAGIIVTTPRSTQ